MTSKQRAYLRSLASSKNAIFQVGKNEISENMVIQISNALEAHELIKISILENISIDEVIGVLTKNAGIEDMQISSTPIEDIIKEIYNAK